MTKREKTKKIMVGNVQIGNQNKVVIQSMTTTRTSDTKNCLDEINQLVDEGAELVRVAVLDEKDALALKEVTKLSPCPIIADIHFNPVLAILAIENGASKIRLNPGNIKNEDDLKKIIKTANEYNVPIRVGVNSGSLPIDLMYKYGVTPKAMIIAVSRYIKLFEENGFNNIVISLKATDPLIAIKAYQMASRKFNYPLHIGITEAGSFLNGAIKSSAGLGVILFSGLGDTMRISLTGSSVQEIKVCKKLLNSLGLYDNMVDVISCPTCGRLNFDLTNVSQEVEKHCENIRMPLKVAILGCAVNGPGEAKEADIGIAGGNKSGIIFEKGKVVKSVPQEDLVKELIKMIDKKYEDYLKGKNNA